MITLYDRKTPETESFIRRIDDSEIDLTQVEAKLHDLECERDCARESLAKIKAWADQALSAIYDKEIAAAFEQISDEADMSNT